MNKYEKIKTRRVLELIAISFFLFSIVLFGITTAGTFHADFLSLDASVQTFVAQFQSPLATAAMLSLSYFGNIETVIGGTVFVIILFMLLRLRRDAMLFLSSIFVGFGLTLVLKLLTARARPVNLLLSGNDSFPSAHALITVVLYGLIAHALYHAAKETWKKVSIVAAATLFIAGIGLSRVYLNVHWFSDVIAGWLLGLLILCIFIILFDLSKK